ncbi:MAG TPA: 2OG-Fe(II) oxygenase family protein [Sphingomicrobium sp.]
MSEPQVVGLFETNVVVDEMPGAEALNRELARAIQERRRTSAGTKVSNIGGWQSDTAMLEWGGATARRLLDRIVAAADHFTVDVKSPTERRHEWRAEMWANVSPPHASNQLHTHPGAFWSAVYYVDDGYAGSSDPGAGGELVLMDPRMPMIMMTMPNLRFLGGDGKPNQAQLVMRPKSGRIVMFPAWLSHGVMPYEGPSERISIAVNLLAVPRGAA